jgi:hypothetical protein
VIGFQVVGQRQRLHDDGLALQNGTSFLQNALIKPGIELKTNFTQSLYPYPAELCTSKRQRMPIAPGLISAELDTVYLRKAALLL